MSLTGSILTEALGKNVKTFDTRVDADKAAIDMLAASEMMSGLTRQDANRVAKMKFSNKAGATCSFSDGKFFIIWIPTGSKVTKNQFKASMKMLSAS